MEVSTSVTVDKDQVAFIESTSEGVLLRHGGDERVCVCVCGGGSHHAPSPRGHHPTAGG